MFGHYPKLETLNNWGLEMKKSNQSKSDFGLSDQYFEILAIGDVNTYGIIKPIFYGFNETQLALQSFYKIVILEKKFNIKYTTLRSLQSFDKVV